MFYGKFFNEDSLSLSGGNGIIEFSEGGRPGRDGTNVLPTTQAIADSIELDAVVQDALDPVVTEIEARRLGMIIATDPQYAGGLDPTGAANCWMAMQAIVAAAGGRSVAASTTTPVASVLAKTSVWLPGGTFRMVSPDGGPLKVWGLRGFTMVGQGARNTVFQFEGDFTKDGFSFVGCSNLSLTRFKIGGKAGTTNSDGSTTFTNGTSIPGTVLAIDVDSRIAAGSASRAVLNEIYVEMGSAKSLAASPKFYIGIGIGVNSDDEDLTDLAQVKLNSCHVGGERLNPLAAEVDTQGRHWKINAAGTGRASGDLIDATGWWKAGFQSGSGIPGNTLNHSYNSCTSNGVRDAYKTATMNNVTYTECNASDVGTVYQAVTATRCFLRVAGGRYEGSRRLLEISSGSAIPAKVLLDGIYFTQNTTHSPTDREIIRFPRRGDLIIRQFRFDANNVTSDRFMKIWCSTPSAVRQANVHIMGITCANDTPESLFNVTGSTPVFADVWFFDQYARGGFGALNNFTGHWQKAFNGAAGDTTTFAGDPELNALASTTSAANKLPYFTGSGTATVTDLSAFARTLLDDPDAATALATLGAQPSDADLAAIALLTTTSFGRSFLALADATAGRTLLGLGTIATHADSEYLTTSDAASTYFLVASGSELEDSIAFHVSDTANPHAVTAAQAGAQPVDTDLTAIAALTSAANKMAYATGAGTWALTNLTAYGRTIADTGLTHVEDTRAIDLAISATTLTTVCTVTLPATGTYDLDGAIGFLTGGSNTTIDAVLQVGTAVGTFTGPTSASRRQVSTSADSVSIAPKFVCTTAGTILLRVYASTAGTCKYQSANGYGGATALGATRIG